MEEAQDFAVWEYSDIYAQGMETHGIVGDRAMYGTNALRYIEELAAQSGIKKVRLGVFKNNAAARKLYENRATL